MIFMKKKIFSIITFFYILSFEFWYDSYSEDGREGQLVEAETGRDHRLRQEEAEAVPKELRDLCHRERRGSTDFILGFYDLSYYDEVFKTYNFP